jgi:hypothetical protein
MVQAHAFELIKSTGKSMFLEAPPKHQLNGRRMPAQQNATNPLLFVTKTHLRP